MFVDSMRTKGSHRTSGCALADLRCGVKKSCVALLIAPHVSLSFRDWGERLGLSCFCLVRLKPWIIGCKVGVVVGRGFVLHDWVLVKPSRRALSVECMGCFQRGSASPVAAPWSMAKALLKKWLREFQLCPHDKASLFSFRCCKACKAAGVSSAYGRAEL